MSKPSPRLIGGMDAIREHLFVLAPNNSGSTFLTRALGLSPGAWSLPREGQHLSGFAGPSSRGTGTGLLWAANADAIARFSDPAAYDWQRTRSAWHFQATAGHAQAKVLVVSSPPFLLIADQLARHFPDARFVLMVRNPYAMVEGILRGTPGGTGNLETASAAARHVVAVLERQSANRAVLGKLAVSFTYEEMCRNPQAISARILELTPALGAVRLDRRVAVKGNYDEDLRDMNAEQIARLNSTTVAVIEAVFDCHRPLFDALGYARLAP
jgi:hypothetical protein